MPSIGQTWVLASIGAVVEMGVLSTLKRLLMESTIMGNPMVMMMAIDCSLQQVKQLISDLKIPWGRIIKGYISSWDESSQWVNCPQIMLKKSVTVGHLTTKPNGTTSLLNFSPHDLCLHKPQPEVQFSHTMVQSYILLLRSR
jgi:hypothetical protein